MIINKEQIASHNQINFDNHDQSFDFLANQLSKKGYDVEHILKKVTDFQVAIPSWALGAGGTRFGRFSYHGEPGTLEQKIEDVGMIHALTQSAGAISLQDLDFTDTLLIVSIHHIQVKKSLGPLPQRNAASAAITKFQNWQSKPC